MFYTLRYSFKVVEQNHLKFGQESLKELVWHCLKNCDFSSKGVTLAAWRISMVRHEQMNGCKSNTHSPICTKLQWLDKSAALNTLICHESEIVCAPPSGNWKYHEMSCLILWCTAPPSFTQSTSKVVWINMRPSWWFSVKIVSFRLTAHPSGKPICNETSSPWWGAWKAQKLMKFITHLCHNEGFQVWLLWLLNMAKWLHSAT